VADAQLRAPRQEQNDKPKDALARTVSTPSTPTAAMTASPAPAQSRTGKQDVTPGDNRPTACTHKPTRQRQT